MTEFSDVVMEFSTIVMEFNNIVMEFNNIVMEFNNIVMEFTEVGGGLTASPTQFNQPQRRTIQGGFMKKVQERVLESLGRVQVFLDTHPAELGAIINSAARRSLYAAVDSVKAHHDNQGTAVRESKGRLSQQGALARELARTHMIPIATFARTKLRDVPEIADITKRIDVQKPKQLVADARTMANVVEKYLASFVAESFPADFVDQLNASTDALEAAMKGRVESSGRRKAATDSIDHVLRQGRAAVSVIDALIKRQLKAGDPLLMTWKSESRIQDKPGRVRGKAGSESEVPKAA